MENNLPHPTYQDSLANVLNQACACTTLPPQSIQHQLAISPITHPHLFSNTLSFVSAQAAKTIQSAVSAVERIAHLRGYQQQALSGAPAIANASWGPSGVFMGYDFHLSADGPRLIEINTNAGGALLNTAVLRAHRACCEAMEPLDALNEQAMPLEAQFLAMFKREWRLQKGEAPLLTIAIVDDAPSTQYLAPEFELFKCLFEQHGFQAIVADAADLQWRDGALWHPALPAQSIDLVYNRLTDFYLSDPTHAALRSAYLTGTTAVTPHPQSHAIYADKRRLVTLSNVELLAKWGASAADCALLKQVLPHTVTVGPNNAEDLWTRRRKLFFKPAAGFGSKGSYRGDKLTKRVWDEILAGEYVAQELVTPSERLVQIEGEARLLKQDIRAYVYEGTVQFLAARCYAGQTTNFRTPGGGFSPVVVVPDFKSASRSASATCPAL